MAFEVVAAARKRHPRRSVVFVCTTVPLAQQQQAYFESLARELAWRDVESELIVGGKASSLTGPPRVYFATAAKLNAYVQHNGFGRLSLLILDECHHCVRSSLSSARGESKHPYVYCMHYTRIRMWH